MPSILKKNLKVLIEIFFLPILFLWAFLCRFKKKQVQIGLGPEPMINNVYHKRALRQYGYSAETFASDVYYITDDFDLVAKKILPFAILRTLYLTFYALLRYRCLYIYFNGGPLFGTSLIWKLEPLLYKLAGMQVVVMPYGGDVQELLRTKNLNFRHVMISDYPNHRFNRKRIRDQIDLWTNWADHIIAGCDWVDYLYHWDTLMLAHFSIDSEKIEKVKPANEKQNSEGPLRILHAPNHREIKGTRFFIQAIEELKKEGVQVELTLLERLPNEKILQAIAEADVIADQLIIGWYAMFAIEAMALGKPVLCYLRKDLIELFEVAGIVTEEEIPHVRCDVKNVKDQIRYLAKNKHRLSEIGQKGKEFVEKYHSLTSIGSHFHKINQSLGLSTLSSQ